jgi:hypothetical protein
VDSILVVGDRIWRAPGGVGKTCAVSEKSTANAPLSITNVQFGNGIGGGSNLNQYISQKRAYYIDKSHRFIYGIGGGGGASPNGAGGTDWQYHYAFIKADVEYVNPGTNGTNGTNCPNGTGECGGNGGDIKVCNTPSCTSFVEAKGGKGGETVTYECGGQTAKSYGGGGGGGAYSSYYLTAANGGNGGSGSSGTSDTSFVRIYKI